MQYCSESCQKCVTQLGCHKTLFYTWPSMIKIKYYYPVDISTTVFSYSRAVQYHTILHGVGVIVRVLLHRPWGYVVS